MINIRLYTLITLTFTGLWGIVFYVLSGSSIEGKFTNQNNIFYEQKIENSVLQHIKDKQ